jgi:hypothetical protein
MGLTGIFKKTTVREGARPFAQIDLLTQALDTIKNDGRAFVVQTLPHRQTRVTQSTGIGTVAGALWEISMGVAFADPLLCEIGELGYFAGITAAYIVDGVRHYERVEPGFYRRVTDLQPEIENDADVL